MPRVRPITFILSVAVLAGSQASQAQTAQRSSFEAAHFERTVSVTLAGVPEEVFALLEPQGRKQRVNSWNFEFLFPRDGDARAGTVTRQVHRSGAVEQIWVLAEHDPPTRIKYVIFVPGMEVWEFDTGLQASGPGETVATVSHRITSLAEDVNPEVQRFADGFYAYVQRWQSGINAALGAGP
jgi:hypothetical protein